MKNYIRKVVQLVLIFISTSVAASTQYTDTTSAIARMYLEKASAFAEAGETDKSIQCLKLAIKEDEGFVQAYDELALMYSKKGEMDSARMACYNSLKLNIDGERPHKYLAVIYGMMNQLDSSYIHYNELTRIDASNPVGYYGMANIRTLQEDYDAAIIYARKALELYESRQDQMSGEAQYLVGILYYYKEEDDQARKYLTIAKKNGVVLDEHLEEFIKEDAGATKLKTEEDYKKTEAKMIQSYNLLLDNPAEENTGERLEACQFILNWVSGSPYVTVSITQKLVPYMSYGESLIIFMGGWAKYCLESENCDKKWKGCLAGTEAVIEYYRMNKDELGKNRDIEKMIKRQKKNKLESYIRENLPES